MVASGGFESHPYSHKLTEAKGFVRTWDCTKTKLNSPDKAAIDAYRYASNEQWEERHLKLNGEVRETPRKTLTSDEHNWIEQKVAWGILIEMPVDSRALLRETRKVTDG
jgi:hypothetical protein